MLIDNINIAVFKIGEMSLKKYMLGGKFWHFNMAEIYLCFYKEEKWIRL